ncbi:MAG: putative coenzyme f390 synthetase [Clostridiales bacterium]|nr:putative coenzyme f390 synthetase [Clostridiales bacterium]
MYEDEKLQALNSLLEYCRKSKFYRDRIPDRKLSSLEEIKQLPLTTKEDLRKNSPYGLVCVPTKELYQYHETFGTTGVPASAWLTKGDFEELGRRINSSGIDYCEEDIVLVRFPYAISTVAHFTQLAAQMKNACVVPASSRTTVSPFTRIISLMRKLGVTVLAGLPTQMVLLAETAEMLGFDTEKDFPTLRAINTGGELLTPRKRKKIEKIWGVPVFDHYGMTEIGPAQLDCKYGTPHPLEESFIFEILDEKLENECSPGEIGCLVVTTLTKRATPLVRYVTGDKARWVNTACPCGKSISLEIRGRMHDMISIGDKSFDLWQLDQILSTIPFGRFWVAGPFEGGIKYIIEQEKAEDCIEEQMVRALEDAYGVKLYMEVVPKGTLYDRSELFSVGIVGKPRYIYSSEEMKQGAYFKSDRT